MKSRFCIVLILLIAPLVQAFDFSSLEKKTKPKTLPAYSSEKFWIALPWRHDIADTIPPGCYSKDAQDSAKVDVFYVHPTVYLAGIPWNADLDDKNVNKNCDACVMNQATPFNSCARVFAPRYRQGHIKCFTRGGKKGQDALDTAYADVKKAFEYYLANWNNGRPIILAGHSQGAYHVGRLMTDFFDGKPLLKQLVAAYPIGFDVKASTYKQIPVGDSATQTGCFMTWNTVAWGQDTTGAYTRYRGSACVNPFTWKQDATAAPGKLHSGAVPFDFKSVQYNISEVKVHGALLWVKFNPAVGNSGFFHFGTNYHVSDVNLFYMNIRENAELRVRTYLSQH